MKSTGIAETTKIESADDLSILLMLVGTTNAYDIFCANEYIYIILLLIEL